MRNNYYTKVAALCLFLLALLAVLVMLLETPAASAGVDPDEHHVIPSEELRPAEGYASLEAMEEAGEVPEDVENRLIEDALLAKATVVKGCTVTYYDCCVACCGKDDGITASGMRATPYVTCAVDTGVIPLGSDVLLDYGDGEIHYLRADDTGVKGNHIDICVSDHQEALNLGVKTATVYWIAGDS